MARRRGTARGLATFLGLAALTACAGGRTPAPGPEAAVRAYVAAVRAGDAAAVHALLDPATRETTTEAEIALALTAYREELLDQAAAIERRIEGAGVPARARWDGPGGALVLRTERSPEGAAGWRFESGVFDAPTLASPVDAVRALRAALGRRSLPGVLGVLSRDARADAIDELEAVVAETGDPAALGVSLEGDRAVVRTPAGREIHVVREAGEWRVDAVGEVPVPPAPTTREPEPSPDR